MATRPSLTWQKQVICTYIDNAMHRSQSISKVDFCWKRPFLGSDRNLPHPATKRPQIRLEALKLDDTPANLVSDSRTDRAMASQAGYGYERLDQKESNSMRGRLHKRFGNQKVHTCTKREMTHLTAKPA